MGVRSSWLLGTLLHWQPTVLTPKSWMPKFSENKPIQCYCHWYWLKWTEFILKIVHPNYLFIYVECMYIHVFPYLITIYFVLPNLWMYPCRHSPSNCKAIQSFISSLHSRFCGSRYKPPCRRSWCPWICLT